MGGGRCSTVACWRRACHQQEWSATVTHVSKRKKAHLARRQDSLARVRRRLPPGALEDLLARLRLRRQRLVFVERAVGLLDLERGDVRVPQRRLRANRSVRAPALALEQTDLDFEPLDVLLVLAALALLEQVALDHADIEQALEALRSRLSDARLVRAVDGGVGRLRVLALDVREVGRGGFFGRLERLVRLGERGDLGPQLDRLSGERAQLGEFGGVRLELETDRFELLLEVFAGLGRNLSQLLLL